MKPDTERALSARADSCTRREAPRWARSVTDNLNTEPEQAAPNAKASDSRRAWSLIGTTGPNELALKTSKQLPSFVELLGSSETSKCTELATESKKTEPTRVMPASTANGPTRAGPRSSRALPTCPSFATDSAASGHVRLFDGKAGPSPVPPETSKLNPGRAKEKTNTGKPTRAGPRSGRVEATEARRETGAEKPRRAKDRSGVCGPKLM